MKERLEKMTKDAASILERKGVAKLWKIPTDLRLTGSGATFGEQTPCDFIGHTHLGRVIMVECKDISNSRLPLSSAGLKPHQRVALDECARAGGLALLLWAHGGRLVGLTPRDVDLAVKNRRSIPWSDCEGDSRELSADSIVEIIKGYAYQARSSR